MLKNISRYWVCQLAGWGAYFAIFAFFYLSLSEKTIDHFFLLITLNVLLGIAFSHLMRMVIKEYKLLQMPVQKQIVLFVLLTIFFSVIYAAADVGLEKILGLRDTKMAEKISTNNEIARTAISNFFFLLYGTCYIIFIIMQNVTVHRSCRH